MNLLIRSKLKPTEFLSLSKNVFTLSEGIIAKYPLLEGIRIKAQEAIKVLEAVLSKDDNSELSVARKQSDENRDDAFMALRDFVIAMTQSPDQTTADAAQKVHSIIEKYGTQLHRLGYQEESAKLELMIAELNVPLYAQALDQLNARTWFDRLVAAHNEFEDTYRNIPEPSPNENLPTTSQAMKTAFNYFTMLLNGFEIAKETDSDANIQNSLSAISNLIGELNSVVRTRRTIANNKKAEKEN